MMGDNRDNPTTADSGPPGPEPHQRARRSSSTGPGTRHDAAPAIPWGSSSTESGADPDAGGQLSLLAAPGLGTMLWHRGILRSGSMCMCPSVGPLQLLHVRQGAVRDGGGGPVADALAVEVALREANTLGRPDSHGVSGGGNSLRAHSGPVATSGALLADLFPGSSPRRNSPRRPIPRASMARGRGHAGRGRDRLSSDRRVSIRGIGPSRAHPRRPGARPARWRWLERRLRQLNLILYGLPGRMGRPGSEASTRPWPWSRTTSPPIVFHSSRHGIVPAWRREGIPRPDEDRAASSKL